MEPDVQDLEELHPSVGRSMKKVLESNEDDRVEDWGLYFSVDREEFGETTEIELVPGGKDIPVTFENRKEYVKTYIQYVFQKSCKEKFRKFEEVRKNRIITYSEYGIHNMYQRVSIGLSTIPFITCFDQRNYKKMLLEQ